MRLYRLFLSLLSLLTSLLTLTAKRAAKYVHDKIRTSKLFYHRHDYHPSARSPNWLKIALNEV